MKNRKVFTLLLTGMLTLSMGSTVYASSTDAAIAEAQAEKQAAENSLAQVQGSIGSLESKKQELESYLADLNAQYEDLTNSISELSIQAAEKEDELNKVKKELKKAKKASTDQYESMKLRIAYMYENAGTSALETLLSSESLAEFLNRAENAIQISTYDRNMLGKYVSLQENIQENEKRVETESAEIDNLMTERASKQQEVQSMAATTSEDINSYVNQISASQEEAQQLMADISNADSNITALVQQAEAEKAAEEKARAEAEAEAERQAAAEAAAEEAAQADDGTDSEDSSYEESSDDYGYDSDEDTTEDSSTSTSSEVVVEEEEEETDDVQSGSSGDNSSDEDTSDSSDDTSTDTSASGSSSQGTYLGNFTLTAYCNCAQCCGTAGNLTASGTVPTAGRTVAMAGVPFGTKLLINGNVYTVEDLGTPYGHVDIYCGSHEEALSFGLQSAEVYQVG
ncbi:hypothetical protein WMO28_08650 [Blautia sp. CLA-JM-H16]|uniref:Peptidoglycan hydrolase PcsB coiled-coil domain-containing protein n=1 Tax=Blautia aquisgranensis TaxID=3133153 RepID=A0ABV1BEG5_9FIRM